MENIDPVYFLTPLIVIAFSLGLVAYWRRERRLTMFVLIFSLVAYFGAILAKAVFQYLTYRPPFFPASGGNLYVLGAYFGLQTVFFEVGGAYLVARYAVTHGMLRANDAEGYGISLALWENGVLIGGSLLVNYAVYYATLAPGSGAAAEQMFAALVVSSPALFDAPSRALPLIGFAILERVSSLLIHFAFGYLCVLAAVFRKRAFLLLALPMGLADFLAPFYASINTAAFEGLVFAFGLACAAGALTLTRGGYRVESTNFKGHPPEEVATNLGSLVSTNFRRALNFGKIYVGMGVVLPLLFIAELSVAGSAASTAGTPAGPILSQLYPLLMPIFVVLGASGALMIFASDKDKGVYEYMLAYGVDVSTIFWSMIAATLGLVTLVLAVSLTLTVVVLAFTNAAALTPVFGELIIFYTVPLSYAAAMFMSMSGMIWSQLTARRPGVNSPVGIAPLLGIAPILAVLIVAVGPGSGHILYVVGAASIAMVLGVAAMASVANSKMQRERFLSSV
jgi:hypothetical protein